MTQHSSGLGSRPIALGGVLAAGSLALLCLASAIPAGRVGFIATAGLFPAVGVLACGRILGTLCWAVTGLLGLLILPDKGAALLYLFLLGLYPVVKSAIESLGCLWVEWCLKLVYLNGALAVCWFLFQHLIVPDPPEWLTEHLWLAALAWNLVFLIYDRCLSQVITLLQRWLFSH